MKRARWASAVVVPCVLVALATVAAPRVGAVTCAETARAEGDASGVEPAAAPDIEHVLARYNEGIRRALEVIESLRVDQEMFEPQGDGSTKRATAVLSYEKGSEMTREETRSDLAHPAGDYSLRSLVGPVLERSEYDVEFEGVEEKEGHVCYRLSVVATVRDVDHFDGTVWISTETLGPVRIIGAVADPPFPVSEIRLDKAFQPGPGGLWLVRRHTGEVEVSLLFVKKRGVRHIFYDGYDVTLGDEPEVRPSGGTPAPGSARL